jgi:hypothetical protein
LNSDVGATTLMATKYWFYMVQSLVWQSKRIRLEDKGFASTNVVLGIGSYSLQFVTRDTHGSAQTLKSEKLVSKYLKINYWWVLRNLQKVY